MSVPVASVRADPLLRLSGKKGHFAMIIFPRFVQLKICMAAIRNVFPANNLSRLLLSLPSMSSDIPSQRQKFSSNRPNRSRGGWSGWGRYRPTRGTFPSSLEITANAADVARPLSKIQVIHASSAAGVAPVEVNEQRSASPTTNARHFSEKRFADAPISEQSKAGVKYEFMSDVQAATLEPALSGKDLLVQARTGTGKTIAFLLPAIERLLKSPSDHKGISILVLSPTRELALQIEAEAKTLMSHHNFKVQHAIGGTNQVTESKRLLQAPCDILIATPGRLLDHLKSSTLPERLTQLKTIVYDEADRLLDQGFSRDLGVILSFLPPKHTRQALLFSATVSEEIKKVAAGALQPGYSFITTLLEDEVNTHEHVEQTYIITPQSNFMQTIIDVLRQDFQAHLQPSQSSTQTSASKCMVFFPTARQVSFAAELLPHIPGLPPIFDIHSRKTQSARIKATDQFKKAKSAILLSSDVTARGVDFPGVTLVLQMGLPASSEQYIHRLGRTARAGAAGRGILVLSPEEDFFLLKSEMAELGLKPSPAPAPTSASTSLSLSEALSKVSPESKSQAYRAFLGYYNTNSKPMRFSKEALVQFAWKYAVGALGWPETEPPPGIDPRTVGKMNLKGVKGLNLQMQERPQRSRKPEVGRES